MYVKGEENDKHLLGYHVKLKQINTINNNEGNDRKLQDSHDGIDGFLSTYSLKFHRNPHKKIKL